MYFIGTYSIKITVLLLVNVMYDLHITMNFSCRLPPMISKKCYPITNVKINYNGVTSLFSH